MNDKKAHLAKRDGDISSLRRNLTNEFYNIPASGDKPRKDTIEEGSEYIKEEAKQSLLDYTTPLKHEGFSLNNSAFNSMMNTPMKPHYEDPRHSIPSFHVSKNLGPKKANMPQFMQMIANTKDNNFRINPDTSDSQHILEEICGKKRRRTMGLQMPNAAIQNDPRLRNSIIYSPCPGGINRCYSDQSDPETPHLRQESEEMEESKGEIENFRNQHENAHMQHIEELESESNNGISENNPGTKNSRSERGLKRLSVKVRDLVFRLKETSYKDVANRLIEELVRDSEYDMNGRKLDQRSSSEKKTKDEKNVRRRVYDALNVLIASGVLKKNSNKNVMFEEKPQSRMKGLKLIVRKKHETRKRDLIRAINQKKKLINEKYIIRDEAQAKLNALKNLLSRNKNKELKERKNSRFMSEELTDKILEDKR